MSGPRAVRAGSTAAAIVLGAAFLVGVNYLAARHWWRGDWTKAHIYSLSETSRKVAAGLKAPVRVTVFMTRNSRLYQPVSELLNRYRQLSPKIEIEFLDPERNPARAEALVKEFGIRQNTVVFRSGDRKKYVEEDKLADFDFAMAGMGAAPAIKAFKGEEAFTSALLDVTQSRVTRVYFTVGHGEPSIDSSERGRGFAQAKQLLERANITVGKWSSLGKSDLPADATVIVVAGPRTGFLEPESGALSKFLAAGGRALVMLDPVLPRAGSPPTDLGVGAVIAEYGVKLNNDIVIDPANAVPQIGLETFIANRYGTHPIVRSLSAEGLPVLFSLARSLSKSDKPAVTPTMLVESTPEAWGETSLANLDQEPKKDPTDTQGPVTLAFAASAADDKKPEEGAKKAAPRPFRVVVVGNSRFAENGLVGTGGNANLFLNAIQWLAGDEKLVGIAPKTPEQASLSLTRAQVNRIGLFTVLGLPAMAVALGVWVWYRRRD